MGRKLKFVLSDLHLGAGFQERTYLEGFAIDNKLARFLQQIRQESDSEQREIELIINGDLFEFLQVPAVDHYDPATAYSGDLYLDSSEAASLKRLNLIAAAHPEVFNALSDFMRVETPQRRITIIKGNHDVSLYWSGVKARLREILGASGARSSLLLFAEEFVSREKIYIEHGHQRAEKMNSYHDFLDPRQPTDLSQLFYPAGSRFAIDVFNDLGREHWFFDFVKPMTALIWYALSEDFDFAARMLARFIRHTPALVLSDFTPAETAILADNPWLGDLENSETRRSLADRYAADADFRQQFHRQMQAYLNDATAIVRDTFPPPVEITTDPLAIGQADQRQQQAALRRAAEEIAREQGARVVLFGHTHCPTQETLETGGIYLNTGCWLPSLCGASPEMWRGLFDGSRQLTDLKFRLPYARIDYDEENNPNAQLLFFAEEDDLPDPQPEESSKRKQRSFLGKRFAWFTKILAIANNQWLTAD